MEDEINQDAIAAFVDKVQQIADVAEDFSEWADDMAGIAPDEVTWQTVADMNEILARLTKAAEFAGIR